MIAVRSIGEALSAAAISPSVARYDALVRPGSAIDHCCRAIGAVERRELADHSLDRVDRQMDRQCRPSRGENGEALALRHRRGAAGRARQHQRLGEPGSVNSARAPPRPRRRRHAGRDRIRHALPASGGAIARPLRYRSRDRPNAAARRPGPRRSLRRECPTIASRSSGAVSTMRAPGGQWPSSAAGTSEPA